MARVFMGNVTGIVTFFGVKNGWKEFRNNYLLIHAAIQWQIK
jgi:hypothetical protein